MSPYYEIGATTFWTPEPLTPEQMLEVGAVFADNPPATFWTPYVSSPQAIAAAAAAITAEVESFVTIRPSKRIDTSSTPLVTGDGPKRLVGIQETRLSITILNNGAGTLFVGGDSGVSATSGMRISAGSAITIQTKAEVWVVGSATLDVFFLSEFSE